MRFLAEDLFDQNVTIKESDDDELADINAEMVRVEPATPPEEQPPAEVSVSNSVTSVSCFKDSHVFLRFHRAKTSRTRC